jgi:hypothetical protein
MTTFQDPPPHSRRAVRQSERGETAAATPAEGTPYSFDAATSAAAPTPQVPVTPPSGRRAQLPAATPLTEQNLQGFEPLTYSTQGRIAPQGEEQHFQQHVAPAPLSSGSQSPDSQSPDSQSPGQHPESGDTDQSAFRVRDFSPEGGRRVALPRHPLDAPLAASSSYPGGSQTQPVDLDYHTQAAGTVHAHVAVTPPLSVDDNQGHTLTRRELREMRAAAEQQAPALKLPEPIDTLLNSGPIDIPTLAPPAGQSQALAEAMAEFDMLTRARREAESRARDAQVASLATPIVLPQHAAVALPSVQLQPSVPPPPFASANAGPGFVGAVPVASVPVASVPVVSVPVVSVPAPVESAPVESVPVASAPVAPVQAAPVQSSSAAAPFPLSLVPGSSVPVSSVPVTSVPVDSASVEAVPVASAPAAPESAATAAPPHLVFPPMAPVQSAPVQSVPVQSVPVQSATPAAPAFLTPPMFTDVASAPEADQDDHGGRSPRASNHWRVQAAKEDDGLPYENTLSRTVGSNTSAITTSALVLPSVPQPDGILASLTSTGEILITGSINLPRSLGSTGAHPDRVDHADDEDDPLDSQVAAPDSAPVRAIRAVSTSTSTRAVIETKRPQGNRLLTGVIIAASVLCVGLVGLLVFAFATGKL